MGEKKSIFQNIIIVFILAILCNLLWGSAFPSIKIGYRLFCVNKTADTLLFAGIRFALAGLLVILFNSMLHKHWIYPKNRADITRVMILCSFQTVMQYTFFYIGLANTSGVKAAIVNGANAMVAILIASIIPIYKLSDIGDKIKVKEKLTIRILIGCMLGFAGVIVVNFTREGLGGGFSFQGEGFILLSTVAYGLSTYFIKRFSAESDPVMLSGWQFFVGGFILAFVGLVSGGSICPQGLKSYGILLYLALISAVAYTVWGILLKYNNISKIAVFSFTNPVFGVMLSALLLGEGSLLNVKCLISLGMICLGIYLINSKKDT